jgi:hypothetical protein
MADVVHIFWKRWRRDHISQQVTIFPTFREWTDWQNDCLFSMSQMVVGHKLDRLAPERVSPGSLESKVGPDKALGFGPKAGGKVPVLGGCCDFGRYWITL